ncbi:MAG: WD40/YVTN/BNR-like repeat-containing protein [Planctomycetota bacterium]|jgi:photosystem II stability/assembly factor-like uncharacterized protein
MAVLAIVGTDKAAFLLRSDRARKDWRIEGPLFKGWKVTAAARDGSGRYLVATASDVYGPALHVSEDLRRWRQIEHGPGWPKEGQRTMKQIWTLVPAPNRLYAGVDEAGLFASEDGGEKWFGLDGLNEHATRGSWYPGAGGLCAHAVLVDPKNPDRIWCGISAVGVFRSDDGGVTWHTKNEGIKIVIEDKVHKDIGFCVHGLVADPDDADTIYRREHTGMFRTRDGGETWQRCEDGLASWFGFPIAMDRASKALYVVPLESDEYRIPVEGKLRVYRSRNGGDTWEPLSNGLPQEHAYMGVLRAALDVDHLEPGGVYLGTTAGTLHFSRDGGDSWAQLPWTLPRVLSVTVFSEG